MQVLTTQTSLFFQSALPTEELNSARIKTKHQTSSPIAQSMREDYVVLMVMLQVDQSAPTVTSTVRFCFKQSLLFPCHHKKTKFKIIKMVFHIFAL